MFGAHMEQQFHNKIHTFPYTALTHLPIAFKAVKFKTKINVYFMIFGATIQFIITFNISTNHHIMITRVTSLSNIETCCMIFLHIIVVSVNICI